MTTKKADDEDQRLSFEVASGVFLFSFMVKLVHISSLSCIYVLWGMLVTWLTGLDWT